LVGTNKKITPVITLSIRFLQSTELHIINRLDHLQKQMSINIGIALGGLAASIPTGGVSLLGTFLALTKGYKDYQDYKENVTENPAYLLWKIKKGTRDKNSN
jgi:hypothetical protein